MNRRYFVTITSLGSLAIIVPFTGCKNESEEIEILATPETLSHIYTTNVIKEIGKKYLENTPDEAEKEKLIKLIKPNENKLFKKSVKNLVKEKIKGDFIQNNTVLIDGWILAKTEARQCALFSLLN